MKFTVHPLSKERWPDLVDLFSRPGGSIVRGCWCMAYRRSGSMSSLLGKGNKRALKSLVDRGRIPGLIGYEDERPVAWISLGPREEYAKLQRSPIMKPVDDKLVWSIVCFFVDARSRGKGLAERMLKAAIEYAGSRGVTLLEAYPVDKKERSHADAMWFGAKCMYDRAGFQEVARRKITRPVMRKSLKPS